MQQDDIYDEEQGIQETQPTSQHLPLPAERNAHLWGYLIPCQSQKPQIDFFKICPLVTFGRAIECAQRIDDIKISNFHCRLMWDGQENENSLVTVTDLSSNGTFINGIKIGKNHTRILRDGNEISLGSWKHQTGMEEYRYIFRFTASGQPRGELFKYYDMGNALGEGGFATVFRAVSRETGATYAVKRIPRSKFKPKDSTGKNKFMREISILEGLHHRNICKLKEAFFDPEYINLVLEYVDGGDLFKYMLQLQARHLSRQDLCAGIQAPVDEEPIRHATRQICEAVAYIHSKGIAHRDLKPDNILVTKDDPPVIKVADFGLAKAVDSKTKFMTQCGTPIFIAPEVFDRENLAEGYDHLVDSWAVGVIVFIMLTGAPPFDEDAEGVPLHIRVGQRKVVWDNLLNVQHSKEAMSFVAGLLETEPRVRMSLTQALSHIWIRSSDCDLPRDALFPEDNLSTFPRPAAAGLESAPIPSFTDTFVLDDVSQHQQLPDLDAPVEQGFRRNSIQDFSALRIPGAFPASIGPSGANAANNLGVPNGAESNGKKRKQDMLSISGSDSSSNRKSDGEAPYTSGAPPVKVQNGRGNSGGLKKKARAEAVSVGRDGGDLEVENDAPAQVPGRRRQPPRGANASPQKRA
ncbi:kinase-like protein [Rickenella mellea]|uniref:Kinase-like protein n=1 Tax=Rickenella mellea TaxID=50990 RepID=A0A4Y7Q271_9AGAM|nr:kinase-like protein [Rickenella mellea]